MESHEHKEEGGVDEVALKERASELTAEIDRLTKLSEESGENIDVELGSEAYVDHGYMAEAWELQVELDEINMQLKEIDDQRAAQRNLPL